MTKVILEKMKQYDKDEKRFMNRLLDDGIYEPLLLFADKKQVLLLEKHPAVLWKLQNQRQYLRLDENQFGNMKPTQTSNRQDE